MPLGCVPSKMRQDLSWRLTKCGVCLQRRVAGCPVSRFQHSWLDMTSINIFWNCCLMRKLQTLVNSWQWYFKWKRSKCAPPRRRGWWVTRFTDLYFVRSHQHPSNLLGCRGSLNQHKPFLWAWFFIKTYVYANTHRHTHTHVLYILKFVGTFKWCNANLNPLLKLERNPLTVFWNSGSQAENIQSYVTKYKNRQQKSWFPSIRSGWFLITPLHLWTI